MITSRAASRPENEEKPGGPDLAEALVEHSRQHGRREHLRQRQRGRVHGLDGDPHDGADEAPPPTPPTAAAGCGRRRHRPARAGPRRRSADQEHRARRRRRNGRPHRPPRPWCSAARRQQLLDEGGVRPPLRPADPTVNVKAPWIGWASADVTRHVTMKAPLSSFGSLTVTAWPTVGATGGIPLRPASPGEANTRIDPRWIWTASLNRSTTRSGDVATAVPPTGSVDLRWRGPTPAPPSGERPRARGPRRRAVEDGGFARSRAEIVVLCQRKVPDWHTTDRGGRTRGPGPSAPPVHRLWVTPGCPRGGGQSGSLWEGERRCRR